MKKLHLRLILPAVWIFCGGFVGNLNAQDISRELASRVALHFFNAVAKDQKTTAQISSITPVMDGRFVAYYLINFNPEGWVIVAGNQRVLPIIGFNKTGVMDINTVNPEAKFMLDFHKQEINAIRAAVTPRTKEFELVKEYWKIYENQEPSQSVLAVRTVNPILRSTWNQDTFYNAHCPSVPKHNCGPDGRAWAGCVAVAMGQIMNYYRYPVSPRGYNTYYDPHVDPECGTGSQRKFDFGKVSFYWPNMKDRLSEYNNDVASLLFSCGMAVNMDYEGKGSGALDERVGPGLTKFFNFSSGWDFLLKSNYSKSKWEKLLLDEIDINRPVYYSGHEDGKEAGHAFVVDGYTSIDLGKNGEIDNFFHLNYGWGGYDDGYFRLCGGDTNTRFSANMQMIIGLIGPKPTTPNNAVASDDLNDKVSISWADHEMGYHYQVYRGITSDPAKMSPISNWIKKNYFNDLSAIPGIKYFYSVRAATTDGGTWISPYSKIDQGLRLQQCKCLSQTEDICENFEWYNLNDKIGFTSPCWTTWSGVEGNAEDVQIQKSPSGNGASLCFDPVRNFGALNDVVLQLGNRTSGNYELKFNMWIPSNKNAYFNLLHKFTPSKYTPTSKNIWACEVAFGTNLTGSLKVGNSSIRFTYPKNIWFPVRLLIDLNNQKANLMVNNKSVYTWNFSWSNKLKSKVSTELAALNFYTPNSSYQFYVDEVNFTKLNNIDDDTFSSRSSDKETQEVSDNIKVILINYPNPFKDLTTIQFNLTHSAIIELKISDISGKIVATLIKENSNYESGNYNINFDGTDLQNGIYLAVLMVNGKPQVRKLILNKPGYSANEQVKSIYKETVSNFDNKGSVAMGDDEINLEIDKNINGATNLLKASMPTEAIVLLAEDISTENTTDRENVEWLMAISWLLIDKEQATTQLRQMSNDPSHSHRVDAINVLKKLQ